MGEDVLVLLEVMPQVGVTPKVGLPFSEEKGKEQWGARAGTGQEEDHINKSDQLGKKFRFPGQGRACSRVFWSSLLFREPIRRMLNCQLLDEGVEQLVVNSPPSLGYQAQGSTFLCPRCYPVICACSRGSPQEERVPRLYSWLAPSQERR